MCFLATVSLSDVTAHITPTSLTSPVATAAKITISAAKGTSEPDVAFPAVLKGSKQRVPPPVPPRGSPKPKRGGAHSQSSVDTKGDYLNISVNDIPPQTPITSSDDDFVFYGHDFKFKDPVACRMPIAVSEHSVKITKLVASNSFLDFVEEADSITERSHPGKDLIAQTTMMAKFNIDKAVREHLDSGEYDDTSLTDSSSEDIIVHEVRDDDVEEKYIGKQSKSPKQFIKGVVTQIGDKFGRKSPSDDNSSSDRFSVHNVKSSDLISAAKSLKKTNRSEDIQKDLEKEDAETKTNKNVPKQGIITSLSKKLNFNQSKGDKNRSQEKKPRPNVEIKTYSEEHSRGMTKDEVICHRKAKNKIDMFQKHIWKVQSDSESSSRRSSISSSQESQKSAKPDLTRRVLVKETKKLFEPIEYSHGSSSSIDKKHYSLNNTEVKPQVSKSISGNVHEKIKKFSEPEADAPKKLPRQKRRSFKKRSDKKKVYKMRKDVEEVL